MTFAEKLNNLHSRQTDHTISVEDALFSSVEKSLYEDLYDSKQFSAKKKSESTNARDYALDSMKEIPTEPSYEAGEKIKKHLEEKLPSYGFNPDFEYQGSVICNTHINIIVILIYWCLMTGLLRLKDLVIHLLRIKVM